MKQRPSGALRLEVVGNADRRGDGKGGVAALGELAALCKTIDGAAAEDDERDGRGRLEGAFHVLAEPHFPRPLAKRASSRQRGVVGAAAEGVEHFFLRSAATQRRLRTYATLRWLCTDPTTAAMLQARCH